MEENKGVSLAEIFKVIFKRIWWVIGVTAAIMLVFVLAVQLWYNNGTRTYSVSFSFDFPGMENSLYPDGTTVKVSSLITQPVLSEVTRSDENLAGIDVEKMVAENAIVLEYPQVSSYEIGTDGSTDFFTVTVPAKYFKNEEQAAAFLRAVAGYPSTHALAVADGLAHNGYIAAYDSANSFGEKISALVSQREYLIKGYDYLIANTSAQYKVGGKTLSEYRAQVQLALRDEDEQYLNSLISSSACVYDYNKFAEEYEVLKSGLEKQMAENLARIQAHTAERDKLAGSGQASAGALAPFNDLIARYTEENVTLQSQIDSLEKIYAWIESAGGDNSLLDEDVSAVLVEMDSYRNSLSRAASDYAGVYHSWFSEKCEVAFASNVIVAEGGMNIIIAAIIGAVIGFIFIGVVICVIDLPAYIKSRSNGEEHSDKEEK